MIFAFHQIVALQHQKMAAFASALWRCRRLLALVLLLALPLPALVAPQPGQATEARDKAAARPAPAPHRKSRQAAPKPAPADAARQPAVPQAPPATPPPTQDAAQPAAVPQPDAGPDTAAPAPPTVAATLTKIDAPETVEADVSTRSVAVTSGFKGSEVVVFGTVVNSRQESAESGLYDVVLVVEGSSTPAVVRSKSNVGGIWLNTSSLKYDRVPSYYAIVSTRPLDEIADESVLAQNQIGFKYIRFEAALGAAAALKQKQREDFRTAIVRLKQKEGLYFTEDYGVAFIGKALFRSTVTLPANVKVGPVAVHVLLFRDGELLSRMTSRVVLSRQGVEQVIYASAFTHPLLYGLVAVSIAVAVGLLASLLVRRVG